MAFLQRQWFLTTKIAHLNNPLQLTGWSLGSFYCFREKILIKKPRDIDNCSGWITLVFRYSSGSGGGNKSWFALLRYVCIYK